jgi:hypothetical protein
MQIVLSVLLIGILLSCKDNHSDHCPDQITDSHLPEWLSRKIEELKKDEAKAEIDELEYAWGKAIFINPCTGCADLYTYIYDYCGNETCRMGGFAGMNNCAQAYQQQSQKKLIWKE